MKVRLLGIALSALFAASLSYAEPELQAVDDMNPTTNSMQTPSDNSADTNSQNNSSTDTNANTDNKNSDNNDMNADTTTGDDDY